MKEYAFILSIWTMIGVLDCRHVQCIAPADEYRILTMKPEEVAYERELRDKG